MFNLGRPNGVAFILYNLGLSLHNIDKNHYSGVSTMFGACILRNIKKIGLRKQCYQTMAATIPPVMK